MKNKMLKISGYGLFGSWNLILALLTIFLLFPEMIIPIVTGTIAGSVFLEQGILSLLIFLVPLLGIIIGLTKRFRTDPVLLLKLFYGVELPLFFLVIARLTLFRELHPGTIHILFLSLVAIMAYAFTLFGDLESQTSRLWRIFRQITITCSFILAVYVGLFLLIFIFPVGKEFIFELFTFKWIQIIFENPLVILGVLFIFYTFTLLLGLPFMLVGLYGKAFVSDSQISIKTLGKISVFILVFITFSANAFTFHFANQQNQLEIFSLLEAPITDETQKIKLLEKQDEIQQGLVNAYLASYRYLSTEKTSALVREMYVNSFGMDFNGVSQALQSSFNFLATPFLYQGNRWSKDAKKAEELYLQYFDMPIEKGEIGAINQAFKSNWHRDGMQAGLINKDRQKVLITQQSISIQEKAHSATITLNESYLNQTFERQEIYYYFQLPEEAVLTGLWLSDEQDNPEKYQYTVAPRGAAQKLYVRERDRRVDPALLEQVGPKQYRLRVFPIPPKTRRNKQLGRDAKPLFMQLSYEIGLHADKQWLLPQLLEKRNVFWNPSTSLIVNGQNYQRIEETQWLPVGIEAQTATPLEKNSSQIALNDAEILRVEIEPRKKQSNLMDQTKAMKEQSIAILIDTSFSMNKLKQALYENLQRLDEINQKTSLRIDFYTIAETVKKIDRINEWIEKQPILFGHTTTIQQFKQWQQLENKNKAYKALILLTDQGNYESQEKLSLELDRELPLWILHLGNEPAYAYADKLLDYIYQSGGGVSHTLIDIMERINWKQQRNSNQFSAISENYTWKYEVMDKTNSVIVAPSELSAIIAHQWISADFNRRSALNSNDNSIKHLDGLHRLAKNNSIVSPFSSMIVLVNERQKEELEKLSKDEDRFKRELETGKKSIVKENDLFSVASVPEPEEWALIIVVFIILSVAKLKKQWNIEFIKRV